MARKPIISKQNVPRPQMEVFTTGHAKSWMWNALPSPIASLYSLIAAGSITGLAYFFGDRYASGNGYMWSMIAIGVMTVIGLIVGGFRAMRAKREAGQGGSDGFNEAIKASAAGWDGGAADPAEIARLDDLRKNFQKGLNTFAEYGKDLYSLPWYVIVGEPGSGKTEAIRRSELRFPEALQNKLQGTGGTYSMHWWFTNQAVIIDTAGAMLLQPEASNRFEEFLSLLRTHRKDCPINGLILTIPVDSLLSDAPPAAEQKAKMIAIQLGIIQKALDVRFPIYLMISKSDRLPGFREYFDADGQSAFERQMMGWSNPDPLGAPFEADRIYEAIDAISARLHNRALALLSDPIPPNPAARRLDEVDAVYNFPQVLRTLGPRLRLYLDVIFQTGTWATKPPFFRGIYFTSALREGAQLDQQLAHALGLPMQQLPPGGIFSREKAVFLRDVFIEKIFMERGLVTRLVDIGAHLRRRLMTFYGVTALLLILAMAFAWFVKTRLKDQLEQEQDYWNSANAGWDNGSFIPLVKREPGLQGRPQWTWRGGDAAKGNTSRLKLLEELEQRVHKPLSFSWVFKPISEWRDYLERRREGYLTVFEGSVMKPLVDGARERILWDTTDTAKPGQNVQKKLADAFEQLLLLEEWLAADRAGSSGARPDKAAWTRFVQALCDYLLDPELPGGVPEDSKERNIATPPHENFAADLADLIVKIYGKEVDLRSRDWLSERHSTTREDSALAKAAYFMLGRSAQQASLNDHQKVEVAQRKQAALASFEQAEGRLERMIEEKSNGPREVIENEGMKPLYDASEAYRQAQAEEAGSARATLSTDLVTRLARQIQDAAGLLGDDAPEGLRDAMARSREFLSIKRQGESGAVVDENRWTQAMERLRRYGESFAPLPTSGGTAISPQVGMLKGALESAGETAARFAVRPADPVPAKPEAAAASGVDRVCNYLRSFRGSPLMAETYRNYLVALKQMLNVRLKFPLVNCQAYHPNFFELQTDCGVLNKVERDAQELSLLSGGIYQCEERQKLEHMFQQLEAVFAIKRALMGSGSEQQDGALWISLDALAKAEEKEIPAAQPLAPFGQPFNPGGFPQPQPQPQKVKEGWTNVKVVVGGSVKRNGAPTENNEKIWFRGDEQVEVRLSFARSGKSTEDVYSYSSDRTPWSLLRKLALGNGRNRFPVESSGCSFMINSNPPLPTAWPRRQDFELAPEPP